MYLIHVCVGNLSYTPLRLTQLYNDESFFSMHCIVHNGSPPPGSIKFTTLSRSICIYSYACDLATVHVCFTVGEVAHCLSISLKILRVFFTVVHYELAACPLSKINPKNLKYMTIYLPIIIYDLSLKIMHQFNKHF